MATGKVIQIIGRSWTSSSAGRAPDIYNAVEIAIEGTDGVAAEVRLTAEVQQTWATTGSAAWPMGSTDGLRRGVDAVDTGAPIKVPVGDPTLGGSSTCSACQSTRPGQ